MRYKLFIGLMVTGILLLGSMDLYGGEDKKGGIEKEVWDILNSYSARMAEDIAALGPSAVPVIIEILKGEEWPYGGNIFRALGMIGDTSATPFLLEKLGQAEDRHDKLSLLEIIGQIGDPLAEAKLLTIFNSMEESIDVRLMAVWTLCKIGSGDKVRDFVYNWHDLYERWYFWDDEQAAQEIQAMDLPLMVCEDIPRYYVALKDEGLLIKALRNRWLFKSSTTGAKFDEACQILAEIRSPTAVEALFQLAESDSAMLPSHLPEGNPESWYKKWESVPPHIRVSAVRALLSVSGVDLKRVRVAFDSIPVEELLIIPVSIEFQPDKWNIQWRKEHEGRGTMTCYIGNIPGGYCPGDIVSSTITLLDIVIQGKEKVLKQHPGLTGEVLAIQFNKFEVMRKLWNQGIWPGKVCDITITGQFSDGKYCEGRDRITIAPAK